MTDSDRLGTLADAPIPLAAHVLYEAARDLDFTISRAAVITERAECHKRQCSCGHPSEDALLRLVADRFRDALRDRAASIVAAAPSGAEAGLAARVLGIHRRGRSPGEHYCVSCAVRYPCPTVEAVTSAPGVSPPLAQAVTGAINDAIADHPMWIDDDGDDLDYSPAREALIADCVRQASASVLAAIEEKTP